LSVVHSLPNHAAKHVRERSKFFMPPSYDCPAATVMGFEVAVAPELLGSVVVTPDAAGRT
jgi:hypothetical protein